MEYVPPFSAVDPDESYVDASPAGGVDGSDVPAGAIEGPQREIVNAIVLAGLIPDDADLTQLGQAIAALIAAASGTVSMPDGNAAAPGLPFDLDADSGFFRPGANILAMATAGVKRMEIDASGRILTGEAAAATGYGDAGDITLPSAGKIRAKNTVKAWVNFNGTGTVAIRDSFNITSITDNGTGSYTVNFATAMADTNYAIIGAARSYDDTGEGTHVSPFLADTKTTGAFGVHTAEANAVGDSPEVDILVMGA